MINREKDKKSKLVIQMQDKVTSIEDPDNSGISLSLIFLKNFFFIL